MWVPFHTGIAGNERAEKYTDLATKNIPTLTLNNIPSNDILNSIKKKILSIRQNQWNLIPASNKLHNIKKTNYPYQNRTFFIHTLIPYQQRAPSKM